ncbi:MULTISPECIES: HD domain-containing protein [Pacificibacter]|uniref:HD domain-containing protein n=1 Tax=Pacificibacter TaxID=1042323 RepID=UPI001C086E7C|nr:MULTISPECIES: HD domain-containing protein [Pacificibacter]MBU2934908.1 HD domain-containing protein [Pacificibacter marinus]MDO6616262.1 HD domain-containing protein [Pacificibacter sp. 1_MG-2023]
MTLKSNLKDLARLNAQFAFLLEADKLKTVDRANQVMDRSRFENSAEHSWHAALLAVLCAPLAGADVDLARVIDMLILHDIVEIDAGDHPIHITHNPKDIELAEQAAAARIYGLLPKDIADHYLATWREFETMQTPTARFAKSIDFLAPALQCLGAQVQLDEEREIVEHNLYHGRASKIKDLFPALYEFTLALFETRATDPVMDQRYAFWCEADRLKKVLRATPILDGTRPENSGEHSWHVMLYALTLTDQAHGTIDASRAIMMMLLHDIVEVDAGDTPIHGAVTAEAQQAQEVAEIKAADRLFGLLPSDQGQNLRGIWEEFEAAQTPTALYAKSIDRAQPVLHNLANDGGSWRDYDVKLSQLDTRVGDKITRGCPALWPFIRARVEPWFTAQNAL